MAADRSAPILSVIFKQAEVYGYRPEGSNPCTGIKRYRRRGRERFLTADEMCRLSHILDRHRESHPLESSIVRLLLLTGCRRSEILTLRVVRVPRRKTPSLRQQDRAAHGVAVVRRAPDPRWPAQVQLHGCFRHRTGTAIFREAFSKSSGGVFAPRLASMMSVAMIFVTFICIRGSRTWRDDSHDRQAVGPQRPGHHVEVHASCRCGGSRGGRNSRSGPWQGGLSHGPQDTPQ